MRKGKKITEIEAKYQMEISKILDNFIADNKQISDIAKELGVAHSLVRYWFLTLGKKFQTKTYKENE